MAINKEYTPENTNKNIKPDRDVTESGSVRENKTVNLKRMLDKIDDPYDEPRKDKIVVTSRRSRKSSNLASRFSVVESYKAIRTNIQYSLTKKTGNIIAFTSTFPKDGKTTVAANIAVSFAQLDYKVLLIDADLRKSRINKFFSLPSGPGLSNYLAGLAKPDEVIYSTSYPTLDVIVSGYLPPNPAELISGSTMEKLLEQAKEKYDLIILDTPPVNIVSDSIALSKYTDGIILVVRFMVTNQQDISRAIQGFEMIGSKILGIVLNAVDASKVYGKRYGYYKSRYGYGKNKDYYYSYGYGYGYGYGHSQGQSQPDKQEADGSPESGNSDSKTVF